MFLTENDLIKVGPKLDEMDLEQPCDLENLSRNDPRLANGSVKLFGFCKIFDVQKKFYFSKM